MTLVSICVPVYNGVPYVESAISSALAQSYEDIEVIVVDNDSNDGTVESILKIGDPRVRVFRNPHNLGVVANWNRAIDETSGSYVKLLCADDLLYPDCISAQVEALRSAGQSDYVMASGRRDIIDGSGRLLIRSRGLAGLEGPTTGTAAIRRCVRSGTNIFGEGLAVLLRREAVSLVGAFDGSIPYFIDADYWVRTLAFGGLVAMPETVGAFRVSNSSWSRQISQEQGRQSRLFVREVARRHSWVTTTDKLLGLTRGTAASRVRRAVFWWAGQRDR